MPDAAQPQPTSAAPTGGAKSMDNIMALCKRRGFIYQASEIYGGINGFWDYGPLGTLLKRNLREAWWQDVVMNPCWGRAGANNERVEMVSVDTRIIQNPKVWEASGHVSGFNDPMVDDRETKQRTRADHLQGVFLIRPEEVHGPGVAMYTGGYIPGRVPDFVVVGSTPHEAAASLQVDKKLWKLAGLSKVGPIPVDQATVWPATLPGASLFAEIIQGRGQVFVHIYGIDPAVLRERPAEVPSPFTGKRGVLTEPRQFNLMNFTYTGALFDEANKVYLRPETAQGIFVNFKNVVDTTRVKVPFGIAQTGTAFRNEVTPRNFTFRSREFEQMEIEFFCHPGEAEAWYRFWRDWRMEWWESVGLKGENLQLREHEKDELSHYSRGTSDIEYRFPFTAPGFGELEGIANRGDFDLTQHTKHSGVKLDYFDTDRGELLPNGSKKGERYIPHVIEPSAGLDRGVLAVICEAYTRDESRPSPEFLKIHPRLAPIKAAVFPLVNKDGMPEIADRLHAELVKRFGRIGAIETDSKQSIGKRYARMDEAGCPFCFTIDGQSKEDQTVTVRDRDTGKQERLALDRVSAFLSERLAL